MKLKPVRNNWIKCGIFYVLHTVANGWTSIIQYALEPNRQVQDWSPQFVLLNICYYTFYSFFQLIQGVWSKVEVYSWLCGIPVAQTTWVEQAIPNSLSLFNLVNSVLTNSSRSSCRLGRPVFATSCTDPVSAKRLTNRVIVFFHKMGQFGVCV